MRVMSFLHKYLKKACPQIHETRLSSLFIVASSLLNDGKLSLTSLGRSLHGTAKVKNKIKRVDRLLSNGKLYTERESIYKGFSHKIIGRQKFISILVDWSPCASHDNHILRASFVSRNRSITLYEEVQPQNKLGNKDVHQTFLNTLARILPKHCEKLIITDAGFGADWFQMVVKLGWYFEGRLRGIKYFSKDNGFSWQLIKELFSKANHKIQYLGNVLLTKKEKLACHIYLYKGNKVPTKKTIRKIRSGKMERIYIKQAKEPWLIATSLSLEKSKPKFIINAYKKRMKIEHEFRDIKDEKWGLGLSYTKTRDTMRLNILLLIGAIALFVLLIIGIIAEINKWHYSYQANTVKSKRVLSLIFLGLQVIKHQFHDIMRHRFQRKLRDYNFESYCLDEID